MKKTLLFITCFFAGITIMYSQNTFSEAMMISKIKKRHQNADVLLKATKEYIKSKTQATPDPFRAGGQAPAPGAVAGPTPGAVAASAVPAAHDTIKTDDAALRHEIEVILALADSANCSPEVPVHFEYLDDIYNAGSGIGNAGMGTSSFTFPEAQIIYGITDFVIRRAKEELVEVYLRQWYDKLNKDNIIQPLIPQTLATFDAFINDNALNLARYGEKWKSAFQEDLRNIPVQLQKEDYVNVILTRFDADETLKTQLVPVIAGGDELVYNLYLKKHFVNIIAGMSARYQSDADTSDSPLFKRLVVFSDVLAKACGTMQNNNIYLPANLEDIAKMTPDAWIVFLKLVYFRNESSMKLVFGKNAKDTFCALIKDAGRVAQYAGMIKKTISGFSAYQVLLSGSNTNAGLTNQLSFDEARKVFDLSYQLIAGVVDFADLVNGNTKVKDDFDEKVGPYFTYLSEIGEGISTKQYGKVLDGSISIIKRTAFLYSDKKLDTGTITKLQRFGSFMLNIIDAKDADAVESALDELVPKGQYSLKNTKPFTISLSAYPGIFAGAETIKKYKTDASGNIDYKSKKEASTSMSLSPYLPIGLDFNIGDKVRSKKPDKHASTNFFIQFLDLGSVLNYRLTSDTTEQSDPDISFKQLLSAGFSVMRHFGNSPLTLGAGINYTPDLRKIAQSGVTYQQNAFRYGIFLSIDVTGLILFAGKK